jgi:integrase
MGRRPSSPNAVPRLRVRTRGSKRYYFYDHGGRPRRETALGTDYGRAIKLWAEFEHESHERVAAVITFRYVCDRYRAEVIPSKAPATQAGNHLEIGKLLEFFDDPPGPLEAIEPIHVRQYLNWRNAHPTSATREKALLSHIWNFARDRGYTALPNPCAGIKGYKGKGRDVYIDDAAFKALHAAADAGLRDAMDLAYLTGQRPADVLRMDATHIRDGALEVAQRKTGKKLRIEIIGELAIVIERIMTRKRAMAICSTRLVIGDNGQPLRLAVIQGRFKKARTAAGLPHVQFRDLRAKAGTDKADSSGDARQAQRQLGHSSIVMTEHYIRERRGAKVTPTK